MSIFKRYQVFLVAILILIFSILEITSSFVLKSIPREKLLDGIMLQKAVWEATYLERNLPLPKHGPRDGYWGRILLPKKLAPYVMWMEPSVKIPHQVEVTESGFQIIGDPGTARLKILIIGGSVSFGCYASNIQNTYFWEVNNYLISQGIPCVTYVLASGGWQSDQELAALIYYGLKTQPDIVIFINGLNDLVHGKKLGSDILKEKFIQKSPL